jgi:hypothetical protein
VSLRIAQEPTVPTARQRLRTWDRAVAGVEPAEALATGDRDQLVYELWQRGWTDREIAEHTQMTDYTTARIRTRLGLIARTTREAA